MVDLAATLRSSLAQRYDLEREVGRGAMAVVFLAHDLKHGRRVGIKVLQPQVGSAIGPDRFQREIEVLASLTHPHILPLHDSGEADGLLYFVMPFIEGESLKVRLEREGRLPIHDALRVTREIAGALGFAHRRGIVHRDVKPANILLTEEHALLADFGIAHLAETEGGTLTGTGLALGTPAYFSPEQATGETDIDGRSDIYSLGCVLFEALTGEPPFSDASVRALITRHLVEAPPLVRDRRPDVSDGIEAVVQTALQKEPEKRFQTAEEMAGSLDMVSGGFEAMAAAALRKLIGPRHKWLHGKRLAALMAAAAVALVAGGVLLRSLTRGQVFRAAEATYLLLPVTGGGATAREDSLAERAVFSLFVQLSDWRTIRVVDRSSLEGPAVDLRLAGMGPATQGLDNAEQLAQRVLATHIVRLRVLAPGDSISLVATIRERRRGAGEESRRYDGKVQQLDLVTAGLALDILGVHGNPAELNDLVARSPVPAAHQEFDDGKFALYHWRLSEAERRFRAAVEHDPEFALAHFYLGQTLFWRTARDPQRIEDLGPEIELHARRAAQYDSAQRLREFERSHVDAFLAFWSGRYDEARADYDGILEFNPTDVEALLLRGSVEYEDPWLMETRGGELAPRMSLQTARSMFDSAAYLKPQWELSLGRLFDIDFDLARAAYPGVCFGFETPPVEPRSPYVTREGAEQRFYCPIAEDEKVEWLPYPLTEDQRREAIRSAVGVHERTVARLEHAAGVEGEHARPHEELAAWLLWERSAEGCSTEPERADSLLTEARDHLSRALEIRGDTTPEDRSRLASLLVAGGDVQAALGHADRALSDLGDWRDEEGPVPPAELANVYMVADQPDLAAQIIKRSWSSATYGVPDPAYPDSMYDGGDALATMAALRALGFQGVDDERLDELFRALDRAWGGPDDHPRRRAVLRFDATSTVSPALVLQPTRWESWFDDWDDYGLEVPAVWKGLREVESDPALARRHLDDRLGELEGRPAARLRAAHLYMPIVLASRLREDSTVARLVARAASCPLSVDDLDYGWAMQKLMDRRPGE